MVSLKYFLLTVFLVGVSHQVAGKKFFAGSQTRFQDNKVLEEPPPPQDVAAMARYIVHKSDWVSIGTISVNPTMKGYPFVGLKSLADGPLSNGTGVPYMMMTDMDVSMNDLNHDSRCTLFMTLAQDDYCKTNEYDPQDPRCARVMLTGRIVKVGQGSEEETFARNALIARHPPMRDWPIDHGFFVAKMDIEQVGVLDFFGGINIVAPDEYYKASKYVVDEYLNIFNAIQVILKQ